MPPAAAPSNPTGARVLVIGATSAIAREVARRYAARGARLLLWGRRAEALAAEASDLRVRGAAEVRTEVFSAEAVDAHAAQVQRAVACWGGLDVVLLAHGVLPDQAACQRSTALALASFDTNARSVLSLLTALAPHFEAQGHGVIGVISSPAGERGRASNYVYGAAKAAVTCLCSGLRHRLHARGVRVLTILPGFVDTPMTAGLPKGGPLWAQPGPVADDIVHALDRRNGTLYTPGFWRWILCVVRLLPQALFLRSRL